MRSFFWRKKNYISLKETKYEILFLELTHNMLLSIKWVFRNKLDEVDHMLLNPYSLNVGRPHIMKYIYVSAKFQSNPKESHLIIVKKNSKIPKRNHAFWSLVP